MAPHSSTLAWKIPWTEEPGRLQSMGSLRVRHDWATSLSLFTFHFHALEKEMATHSSFLAWIIPGMGEPGGLLSMGSHRVRHDWSDLAAATAAFINGHWENACFDCLFFIFYSPSNLFLLPEIFSNTLSAWKSFGFWHQNMVMWAGWGKGFRLLAEVFG